MRNPRDRITTHQETHHFQSIILSMTTTIVALDIETTGLNAQSDKITEIGAVRFRGDRVDGEWHSLINPGQRIPAHITRLTGITDAMVRNQPSIHEVLHDLADFVGDAPVLGHNVRFDLGFLRRQGILQANDPLDTYEMAAVLMPNAGRYSLGALAQALQIILPATHRALDDAKVTHRVYLKLYEAALELPIHVLAEIVRLGDNVENWLGYGLFFDVLRARAKEVVPARKAQGSFFGPLFDSQRKQPQILTPVDPPIPLNTEEVAAVLEYGGEFSRYFEQYEHRPEQVEMLRSVSEAISHGQHLMVEAGTGVGKSFAYLIPAALWAIKNQQRVVISTNTINLQDQLMTKDIPDLQKALNINLAATILKGRSNYLCPRRLEHIRRRGAENPEEMRILAKVMVWLHQGGTGDRVDINLNGPVEREIWSRLSAADDGCSASNCIKHTGGACPFYQSRQAAQNAHLIIVNHALLLADVASGSRVLPDYQHLIIDEAHHLEDASTSALSFRSTQVDFIRLLRELGSYRTSSSSALSGAMGRLLTLLHDGVSPSEYAGISHLVERASDHAFQLESLSRNFFDTIDHFLFEQREGQDIGPYSQQVRILPSTRTQPSWLEVEVSWEETHQIAAALLGKIEQITGAVHDIAEGGFGDIDALEEQYHEVTNIYTRLRELIENVEALVFDPQPDSIYWAEVRAGGRGITLQAAPLHIGPLVQKHIWHDKTSVILTSATLTTAGEFDYLRGRLYAEDANELALGSPFDYENSTLLYIPNNIPEPSDRNGHQRAVESSLIHLAKATGGRMLALFTSYAQLQTTSRAIAPALADAGILIFEQGEGASAHSLLESFREADQAVLLGTRAFWEGVDIPGSDLSVLVIVKLPFGVPSDPIIAARSETFEQPFYQYTIPEAILEFRQGFGRLIRTEFDRGVAVILDRRVISKSYGRAFIDSLPQCTTRVGPLQNLPDEAARWLNL